MGWSEGSHVDERRFDHVARCSAVRFTRRQALGAGAAAILAVSGRHEAAAYPHRRQPATRCAEFTCAEAVISSSEHDATASVLVDDDVTITVDGQIVYQDADTIPTRQVIRIGAVAPGDRIRIRASDPVLGQAHQIGPLYLPCQDGAGRLLQTLDASGVTGNSSVGRPVTPFYDREFTLACRH